MISPIKKKRDISNLFDDEKKISNLLRKERAYRAMNTYLRVGSGIEIYTEDYLFLMDNKLIESNLNKPDYINRRSYDYLLTNRGETFLNRCDKDKLKYT